MQQEPLLQENKDRFVIFPINIMTFGNGIKNVKQAFGQLKKLIYTKI